MKKIVSMILIVVMICSTFIGMQVISNAAENAVAKNALDILMEQTGFRIGDFGDNCKKHANNVANKLYNIYLPSTCSYPYKYKWVSNSNWVEIMSLSGSNVSVSTLSDLFSRAKPGDMLQMYWYTTEHTAVVYSSNSSSVQYYQAGKGFDSKIVLSTYSVADLVKRYNASSAHGITLYRFSNYDQTFPVEPYFTPTQVLLNDYDKIHVKFKVNNPTKAELTTFYTKIRKKGETKWNRFKKTYSTTDNIIKISTIASNGGCKYTINDGTTYEICASVKANNKFYYSAITEVTTPARINISNANLSGISSVKFTGSDISVRSLVKVSYNGSLLIKGTDYSFSKDYVKSIGKHKITITGLGRFKGTKTITITVYPKTPTLKSLSYSRLTGRISLKWARVADCTKQQVAISTSSNFSSSTTGIVTTDQSKQSGSIYYYMVNGKKLHVQQGKTYYIKMRAYKIVNGEKIVGKWGSAKSIKCK